MFRQANGGGPGQHMGTAFGGSVPELDITLKLQIRTD
jgi:hypothetical protein